MLVGKALAKQASDEPQGGGSSPGVSRSISPTGKIETGHSDAKPGTGQSSTDQKAPGASSATNLETSHSIGNGKTAGEKGGLSGKLDGMSQFAKEHPYAAAAGADGLLGGALGMAAGGPRVAAQVAALRAAVSPIGVALARHDHPVLGAILGTAPSAVIGHHSKEASQGPGALPESNASQPTGQPAGGKPADAAMVSTADKVRSLTQKQINAPRERDTAGLISQGMNTGDTTAQNAFTHHGGAKTAASIPTPLKPGSFGDKVKEFGRSVKDIYTGSSKKIRDLEEAAKTPGALGESTKKNLLDPAKSEARKKQVGAIAGTGLALAGAGAAGHHALKDKGEHKEASAPTEQDLSIKTASAEELLRKLKEQVSA